MKPTKKIKVLIPDGESHVLSYVINCFAKSGSVKLYVMSDKKNNYMRFSRYIHKFLHHNKKKTEDGWINAVDEYTEKYSVDVIFPIFETGIRVLIENKEKLKNKDKLISLPTLKNFDNACDKELLHKHLLNTELQYPLATVAKAGEMPNLEGLKYPLIAKPVNGSGGGVGIKVLRNQEEVLQYCENNSFECNTIFQEYIKGYDLSANVFCKDGEVLFFTMQKGVDFEKGEETYQIVFNFIEDEVLHENTLALMKGLNWNGVANIDWRFDINSQHYKVIEINTRYWYNVDASAIVGVNFPYLSCLDFMKIKPATISANLVTYYNLKGLVKKIKAHPLIVFNIDFLKNRTPLFFAIGDPLPIIHKLLWRTKNIIFRTNK